MQKCEKTSVFQYLNPWKIQPGRGGRNCCVFTISLLVFICGSVLGDRGVVLVGPESGQRSSAGVEKTSEIQGKPKWKRLFSSKTLFEASWSPGNACFPEESEDWDIVVTWKSFGRAGGGLFIVILPNTRQMAISARG